MSTLPIAPRGIVVSIWGKAYVRDANGQWRPLKLGEVVDPKTPLRTEQDAIVLMVDAAGQVQRLAAPTATETDRVIAALDSADPQAAPAAGLAAGASGGLQAGLRVERVAEIITTVPLASTAPAATTSVARPTQSDAPELGQGAPVTASSSLIAAVEEGSAIALGLSAPGGSGTLQIVVTQVPSIGQIVTAAGAVVTAGSTLSPSELAGLRYVPPADYDGVTPITPFAYSVSNGTTTAIGGTQISLTAVNDAPVANADSVNTVGTAPATYAVLSNDTDVDGGPLVVTSASVAPALGSVVINADGTLTFTAAPGVSGAVPVTYTISDGRGGTASATLTVNVALLPSVTVDAPALSNDNTPPITGTSNLAPGSTVTLTVTDAASAMQTFTTTVLADGSYAVDVPAALADGPFTVVASVSAPGGSASATDGGSIDTLAPTLTVDGPALTNDTTPTITGTTDLPAGATVSLTVTDALGAVQTFTATVQAGGTYSADVPAALAQGNYTVVAAAVDAAGNAASASDNGAVDITAPTLTVDAPALTNDTTPTITGTTDLPAGATVTLTVTDALGAVQTFTATVQAGGTYSADVPAPLAEGSYTVIAAASDAAGNAASANDSGAVDITPPAASLSLDPVTADNIVNADEATGNVLLTGSVGGDVQAGDTVTLVVNGNTYTGAVQPGSTFSIAVAGADLLTDADRRVDASVATTDAAGNTTTATATRDYAVNTAPVAVADTFTISEDSAGAGADVTPGTPGQDSDADGDPLTVTGVAVGVQSSTTGNVGSALIGTWGTLTLAAGGSYTYVPLPVAQTLAAGQTESDVFSYTIADGRGGFATATLTVSVVGENDAAVITGTITASLTETDAILSTGGTLSATDVDSSAAFVAQTGVAGSNGFGTFSITAAGVWNYTTTTAHDEFVGGTTYTDSITVATADGTTQLITVSILGTNDAAVITGTSTASLTETNAVLSTGGALSATDIDSSANFVVQTGVAGSNGFGTFSITAAGVWTYTTNTAHDEFVAGTTYTDSITVATADGTTQVITVSILGTNDAAVISGTATGSVTEAGGVANGTPGTPTATGTLLASDVDNPANTFQAAAAGSATTNGYGTFAMTAGGVWTYTLNNSHAAVQALNVGGSLSDTFTVRSIDGTAQLVTVTINGTNDAAVITGTSAGSVVEAGGVANGTPGTPTATGTLLASDVDNPANTFQVAVAGSATTGGYGTYSMTAGGVWTYTLNNSHLAVQALNTTSAPLTDTFIALSADGTAQQVTITITGSNDAPLALPVSASGLEDSATRIPVALSGSDVDGSVVSFRISSLPANGSLYAAATGGAALTVGAVVSGPVYLTTTLNFNGSTSFGYTATDNSGAVSGNTATATITITPVNDAPTLTGLSASITYTESATTSITRTLIDTAVVFADVDSPTMGGGSMTVAIANVVANQDLLDIRNQGTAAGQISVVGTDVRYNFGSGAVSIGTLSGGTGVAPLVVSFNANATPVAVDALIQNVRYGNGAQLPDTTPRNLSFTIVDGGGTANGGADTAVANVIVNIVSSNDAPTFAALGGGVSYTERAAAVVLDSNATLNDPELGTGFVGSLNNLGGATLTLVRSGGASTQDQFGGSGTLTLSGGNVLLSGVAVGTYSPAALASGTLAITFSDGTTVAQANSVLQRISYANTSNAPPASVPVSFTFSDGNTGAQGVGGARSATGSVTVNITAINDAPVANPVSASGLEDATSIAIALSATDVDSTIASYTVAALPGNGTLYTNAALTTAVVAGTPFTTATLYFVPAADFNGAVSFNYTASDGALGSNVAAASITITAVNDAPINTVPGAQTTAENTPRAITGLAIADVDAGASSMTVTLAVTNGTLTVSGGTASIAGSGTSTVTLTGSVAQVNATLAATVNYVPAANFSGAASLTITTSDNGNTGVGGALTDVDTVAITVTPVAPINNAPIAVADSASLDENAIISRTAATGVLANDIDADIGDTKTVTAIAFGATNGSVGVALDGIYGTLTLDADGSYSYSANRPAADALALGEVVVETFSYTMRDSAGATSTTTLSFTITGTNDAAVITGTSAGAVTEAGGVANGTPGTPTATGTLLASDVDNPANTFQATAAGSATTGGYGTYAMTAGGVWTYTLNNSHAAVQALNVGGTLSDTFTARSIDGTAQLVTVTINGTNDAATVSSAVVALSETNAALTAGGTLTSTDVDNPNNTFTPSTTVGTIGSFSIDAAGVWTFTANSAFDSLNVGDSVSETYNVTSIDGTPGTVQITINGTNDAAIITGTVSGSVIEAGGVANGTPGTPTATGTLLASDVDNPANTFQVAAAGSATTGGYGTYAMTAGGVWTYTLNNSHAAVQALNVGGTLSDTFTVRSIDGTAQLVTVTINGTNDAAVITGTAGGSVVEAGGVANGNPGTPTATGTLLASDVDNPANTFQVAAAGSATTNGYGTFAMTAGGVWTYTLNNSHAAVQALNVGGTLSDTFTVRSADGTVQLVTVTINGSNDAPTSLSDTFTRVEGSNTAAFGNVLANDSDVEGDAISVAQVATSATGAALAVNGVSIITTALGGTVVMNTDGTFRYIAPVVTHDAANTPVADSFVYRASDGVSLGAWTTVTLSLTDTNPTAVSDAGTVAWAGTVSGNILTNDIAIDASKALVSVNGQAVASIGTTTITTTHGSLLVSADGSFSYISSLAQTGSATGTSESAWRANLSGLWAFNNPNWASGSNLNLGSLPGQPDLVDYAGGSKPGLSVENTGIQLGESLILHLPEPTRQVTFGLNQLNGAQPSATWAAYNASGVLVDSGTFAAGPSNGTLSLQTVTTSVDFSYVRLSNSLSGAQGYVLGSLDYQRSAANHIDSFSYTMRDGDGDTASSTVTLTPGTTSSFSTSLPNGTAGNDTLAGDASPNVLSGLAGDDVIRGFGGNDTLDGGDGNDYLDGGFGDDVLIGGNGNDILIGGPGNDILTGGAGADVFAWRFADRGAAGTPAIDRITDFHSTNPTSGNGDVLDLRDLLQGETTSLTLDRYLDFNVSGGNTEIRISSSGNFASGNYAASSEDQRIILEGVDIRASLGLTGGATDYQIITELINRGKLVTDVPPGG